jgi:hypothetical protein
MFCLQKHTFLTEVGESQVFNLFNQVLSWYDNIKVSIQEADSQTESTLGLRKKYGGKRGKLLSEEEAGEMMKAIEASRIQKEDEERGGRKIF